MKNAHIFLWLSLILLVGCGGDSTTTGDTVSVTACNTLEAMLAETTQAAVSRSETAFFNDAAGTSGEFGCVLTVQTRESKVGDFMSLAAALREGMIADGWQGSPLASADDASTTHSRHTKSGLVATLTVSTEGEAITVRINVTAFP